MGVPLISDDDDDDANAIEDDNEDVRIMPMKKMTMRMRMVIANEKEEDGEDDVLDGLSGGHPDELALLSQVAAARPKVLKVSFFMVSSKSDYCHHCHSIYHEHSTKALIKHNFHNCHQNSKIKIMMID